MTNETRPASSSGGSWIGIISALAAAAVIWGLRDNPVVEVFGLELNVTIVALVLWTLGFIGGMFNRRRQG